MSSRTSVVIKLPKVGALGEILYWERNGFCLWQKRLESERFKWPQHLTSETVTLTGQELNWLLDGFDVWRHPPHKTLQFESVS